jgi:tRNA(fMet)-specific endonuclease VapC
VSLRYLLDTNVISEPLRPTPSKAVLARLHRHQGEIAIASVVWHELQFGVSRLPPGARRHAIERYLEDVVAETVPVLSYDREAAGWHAGERARLVAAGKTPPFADAQTAAIAHVHDLTLVTANAKDFSVFADLRVRNWA